MGERVMVVGKGGREHALGYRLARNADSRIIREVLITPGNDGTSFALSCMRPQTDDIFGIVALAKHVRPDLIVIGPEDLLAEGIVDALRLEGFNVFGPSKKAAEIESSKLFMKSVAVAAQIPTAQYAQCNTVDEAMVALKKSTYPIVVKADGLCAGKGVVVAQNEAQALFAIRQHIEQGPIVIEEFLAGVEMSVIGVCSQNDVRLFAPVADHKRLLNNNQGPNTGGMGVVGPCVQSLSPFLSILKERVFLPALSQLQKLNRPFQGALFAGLMVQDNDFRVLEFNARFGDPETQALMFGTNIDLYPLLYDAAVTGRISEYPEDFLSHMSPTSVITMASPGYPDVPIKGIPVNVAQQTYEDGMLFFAGVARGKDGGLVTDGGRVLNCAARGASLHMAVKKSYDMVAGVTFQGAQYRTDIGKDFL